jgi:hypothetical protein
MVDFDKVEEAGINGRLAGVGLEALGEKTIIYGLHPLEC